MAWTAVAADIDSALEGITGIGQVHTGRRWLRDETTVTDLFGNDETRDDEGRKPLRGWTIAREEVSEQWWSTSRTMAAERWVIDGFRSVDSRQSSETTFQALLDTVWSTLRAQTTLGAATVVSAARTPTIEHVTLGGRLCHFGSVELLTEEYETISANAAPPTATDSVVTAREGYSDAASQITSYLDDVTNSGRVHGERKWATTRRDLLDLFVDTTLDEDERRILRAWQVYRKNDEEDRGIGNRVTTGAAWALECSWSWRDSDSSYVGFQVHIDAVRDLFRGLPDLGSASNVSQSLSSPLQVVEIGARDLSGVLTHFADCRLNIEEVVHA